MKKVTDWLKDTAFEYPNWMLVLDGILIVVFVAGLINKAVS